MSQLERVSCGCVFILCIFLLLFFLFLLMNGCEYSNQRTTSALCARDVLYGPVNQGIKLEDDLEPTKLRV